MCSEPYARIGISNFSITFAHGYDENTMSQKVLLNEKEVNIILHRLACQLIEKHNDFSNTILGPTILSLTTFWYFIYFWSNGRRTLGMSTWSHELVKLDGSNLSEREAFFRLVLNILLNVIGLLWMIFDKNNQTLTDKILKIQTIKRKRSA